MRSIIATVLLASVALVGLSSPAQAAVLRKESTQTVVRKERVVAQPLVVVRKERVVRKEYVPTEKER